MPPSLTAAMVEAGASEVLEPGFAQLLDIVPPLAAVVGAGTAAAGSSTRGKSAEETGVRRAVISRWVGRRTGVQGVVSFRDLKAGRVGGRRCSRKLCVANFRFWLAFVCVQSLTHAVLTMRGSTAWFGFSEGGWRFLVRGVSQGAAWTGAADSYRGYKLAASTLCGVGFTESCPVQPGSTSSHNVNSARTSAVFCFDGLVDTSWTADDKHPRKTNETAITVDICLDGTGKAEVSLYEMCVLTPETHVVCWHTSARNTVPT